MLSSELAAGNMIRAKTGKREITPYLWVHPEEETACVQSVRRRVFATKICSCPIRPCRRVALVAWPGPDVCRPDNVARRAASKVTATVRDTWAVGLFVVICRAEEGRDLPVKETCLGHVNL